MKLQRTTWILILLALTLGGAVYFYEVEGGAVKEATNTNNKKIFSFQKDDIQGVTVIKPDQTVSFERIPEQARNKSTLSQWQMKKPEDTTASDPAVAFLLNLLVDAKSERTLTVPASQLAEYGLDKPQATIEVKLKNQKTHQLILGKPDFNRSFLYAQVDPPAKTPEQLKVLLVPLDMEYGVNRPLSEWKETKEDSKSDSDKKSDKPTAEGSGKASPSPSASPQPTQGANSNKESGKPTAEGSDKASPSPSVSPQPSQGANSNKESDKPTAEGSDKASPSPSASPQTTQDKPSKPPQVSPSASP